MLGDFLAFADTWGKHARGILFRRSYPEFEEIERRSHEIFPHTGANWQAGKRTWHWPNEATLKLRFLDKETDADNYIGHSYTWLGVDQGEQWPSALAIDKLRATLRAGEIKMPKYFRMTANPGGVGHNWIKSRYRIGVQPPMRAFYDDKLKTERVYIPSRLEDNEALMRNDPEYWARVEASVSGNAALLKAWRWGIWDIVAGGMFDDVFNYDVHVLPVWTPTADWYIDRSLDWGSSKPFHIGFWAESPGAIGPKGIYMPYGTVVLFNEWYGCRVEEYGDDKPNEGLKLSSREVAEGIKQIEDRMKIHVNKGPADSSIYAVHDGKSIADEMKATGIYWRESEKGPGSRVIGWELMRTRMRESMKVAEHKLMEKPGLFVTENCLGWLRTVPILPRHKIKTDDVDSEAEDHPGDGTRYRLLTKRPQIEISEFLM